jgi:hypothetical protein
MAFPIVILLGLLIIAAFVLYLLREQLRRRARIDEELHDDQVPTLEYAVPQGQDPVVILTALERHGYTAMVDTHGTGQVVMVRCPGGVDRDRAHVRALIESANVTTQDDGMPLRTDVRFTDEV